MAKTTGCSYILWTQIALQITKYGNRKLGKTALALSDTKAKKEKKLNCKEILQTQGSGKSLALIKSLYFP